MENTTNQSYPSNHDQAIMDWYQSPEGQRVNVQDYEILQDQCPWNDGDWAWACGLDDPADDVHLYHHKVTQA